MGKMSQGQIYDLCMEVSRTEDADRLHELVDIGASEFEVLTAIASNKNTSAETLHYLIHGDLEGRYANVLFSVCMNANLGNSDMWHLLRTYDYGRGLIGYNPSATSEMLEYLAYQIDDWKSTGERIALHDNVNLDTLDYLSTFYNGRVLSGVLDNKRTRKTTVLSLSGSNNPYVRNKAFDVLCDRFGYCHHYRGKFIPLFYSSL